MAVFSYQARDARGQTMSGTLESPSQESAMTTLLERGLTVLSMAQQEAPRRKRGLGVKSKDLIVFTRQLATMIDAGLPMMECLITLETQSESANLRKVVGEMRELIERGSSFSEALETHPRVFTQLYVSMVRAGEKGGFLPEVLDRIATYLEANSRLQKKVKSAMTYPIIVLVIAFGITAFLVFYMLPFFAEMYKSLGSAQLPLPTQILMNTTQTIRENTLVTLLIGGAVFFAIRWVKRTPPGREIWDRMKLKLPVFGKLMLKIELARFLRTFASLVKAGVPILEIINIVSRTAGNILVEHACRDTAQSIQRGEEIAASLERHRVFPSMMVRMIRAGEKTGRLETMLDKVAQFYEEEVEATLSGLAALIEPVLICVIGVIVGGIVICLFLPILKLSDVAKF